MHTSRESGIHRLFGAASGTDDDRSTLDFLRGVVAALLAPLPGPDNGACARFAFCGALTVN
jgi:hypothetical protein